MKKISQCWKLLSYMKKNPNKEIMAINLNWNWLIPPLVFVWSKWWSRLSNLLAKWLIDKIWYKQSKFRFANRCKSQAVYKINEKGLNYKLK